MGKYRAIPEGYMRIGELAKTANVSINTLRHYHKEGLLSPSAASEGGYRLYTDKDLAKLMQVLTMKELGFTLNEIKIRTAAMDTATDVVDALTEHATNIRREITRLTDSLGDIEALKSEIVKVNQVNFKKFADILANLKMKNKHYWMVKYLDDDVLAALKKRVNKESAAKLIDVTNRLILEAAQLHKNGTSPESKKGQEFAEKYWESLMSLMDGDIDLLQRMSDLLEKSTTDERYDESMTQARQFMSEALKIYRKW